MSANPVSGILLRYTCVKCQRHRTEIVRDGHRICEDCSGFRDTVSRDDYLAYRRGMGEWMRLELLEAQMWDILQAKK